MRWSSSPPSKYWQSWRCTSGTVDRIRSPPRSRSRFRPAPTNPPSTATLTTSASRDFFLKKSSKNPDQKIKSERGKKGFFSTNTLEKRCCCSGGHCLCCLLVEDADAGFLLRAENHSVHSSLILYSRLRVHGDGPWKQHELGGHRRSQAGTRQAFKAFLFVSNAMLQLCATPQIPNSSGPRCLVEAPLLAITAGFAPLGRRISRPSLQILCPVGWQQLVDKCPLVTLSCLLLRRSLCLELRVLEHCSDSLSLLELFCICIQILWISASDHLLFTFYLFYFQMLIGGCNNSTLSEDQLRGHFKQYISCNICGSIFSALCLVLKHTRIRF